MSQTVGPIIFDVSGYELSAEDCEILDHPLIGGVIFFSHNYESPSQITRLVQSIRHRRKKPILLAVDQEGGRVQRFRKGFTPIPSMRSLGTLYDTSPTDALKFAEICGWIMAAEVLAVGADLSFAPVLDIDKGISSVIGNRAFHTNTEHLIKLAQAFIKGMREAGMAAVGKHFPGHGSVTVDSHKGLPIDDRSFEQIENDDLIPFKELQSQLQGMMPAHILFPEVDEQPVGFSRYWLQTILREKLKFSGLIFSDALDMEGAASAGNYADRAKAALSAGCDMALICQQRKGLFEALDGMSHDKFLLDQRKLAMVQSKIALLPSHLKDSEEWSKRFKLFEYFSALQPLEQFT